MDEKALSTTPRALTFAEMDKIAAAFVASGMFGRSLDKRSQAITKIMAGQELGLAPFASMRAVHVIEGNATLSANTMAGMVKSSGRYDYTVVEKSANKCSIDFYQVRAGERVKLGNETFDMEEAKTADLVGKDNWRKYPKAMMFARCMSNGVRTYCPDVFNGLAVYTPDELEAESKPAKPAPVEAEIVEPDTAPVTKPQLQKLLAMFRDAGIGDRVKRLSIVSEMVGRQLTSAAELTKQEASDVINQLAKKLEELAEEVTDDDQADDEPEETLTDDNGRPLTIVTPEIAAGIVAKLDMVGLNAKGRNKFLTETVGTITTKNLDDEQWMKLEKRTDAVLAAKEDLPEEWFAPKEIAAKEAAK